MARPRMTLMARCLELRRRSPGPPYKSLPRGPTGYPRRGERTPNRASPPGRRSWSRPAAASPSRASTAPRSTTSRPGSGIRKPSLLHHFPSKEAIYREVFETSLADWIVRIEVAGDEPGPGRAGQGRRTSSPPPSSCSRPTRSSCRIMRREALDGAGPPGLRPRHRPEAPLRPGGRRSSTGRWATGTSASTTREQLILTGLGAILGYFSDVPFLQGVLGRDPLDQGSLEARLARTSASSSGRRSSP